jgi:Ti-type conjugative transfer relaxase TraA
LAIYHLTVSIISRARGQSAVAAAAYRAGDLLRDERYGVTHNYVGKRGIAHSEIMAPEAIPAWVRDREVLWNRIEAAESRKDSQLARLVEVGLPIELDAAERLALVREYIATEFVAQGMVADFCIRGQAHNPHAHILLTLRGVTAEGFGPKQRNWNGKAVLQRWRVAWAECANDHLARAGHSVRIDHRTLEAQQIELMPGRRIGLARARRNDASLPEHLVERLAEQQRIARENGDTMLADPTVALSALTHQRPIFTEAELNQFLLSRTEDTSQFDAVLQAVKLCAELVPLTAGKDGTARFTSRDMVEAERSLVRRALTMASRRGHSVPPEKRGGIEADAWRDAFDDLLGGGDIKTLVLADHDKSALLAAAHRAWAANGTMVLGTAPSRRAAELLETSTGIKSRTLAEYESQWESGGELGRESVLVLDCAQGLGLKQLERLLAAADRGRAKAVLVAQAHKLGAMKVDSPFATVRRAINVEY